jgi:hypothetical protein
VEKAETDEKVIFTDFSCLPITGSEKLAPDFWTFDCARPMDVKPDSEEFGSFSPDMDRAAWCYGETGNGSVGRGLYQNTQGARLRYTPAGKTYGDMSVTVEADPAKTAGQGFGSAGQYMDVCIKFDTERLSGYGLRIQRRKEASDAVFMALVEYREGHTRLLTDFCITSCFLTGCTIRLAAEGGMLRATVTTKTAQSESHREKGYAHRVTLSAPAEENSCGGLCLWHTGTPGTGGWQNTTMLHSIEIRYL